MIDDLKRDLYHLEEKRSELNCQEQSQRRPNLPTNCKTHQVTDEDS